METKKYYHCSRCKNFCEIDYPVVHEDNPCELNCIYKNQIMMFEDIAFLTLRKYCKKFEEKGEEEMKVGDKYYEAWVTNTKGLVMYHEYTIKEVTKGGAWVVDKYENEQYWSLLDLELHFGKTKQEAIDKCIKMYKTWIDDFEMKIKIFEQEKEKINGN